MHQPEGKRMKVLIKSAWGSADPTQASFPFHHANAFAEAGHAVQIFLLGEAVSLMRAVVAGSVVPVGWAPLSDALAKVVDHRWPGRVGGQGHHGVASVCATGMPIEGNG